MAIGLDNTVSLGHLLTARAMPAAAIMGYATLRSEVGCISTDVSTIRADAVAREARVRSVEIGQGKKL